MKYKLSVITTKHYNKNKMSPKQCPTFKMPRLRTTPLLLFIALVLLSKNILGIQASADYGEPEDLSASGSGNSEAVGNNDEIYDSAVLQQEVEVSERRHRMEADEVEMPETKTEVTIKAIRNVSKNQIATDYSSSLEHDNMTGEEVASEEYGGNLSVNVVTTQKTLQVVQPTIAMISEYVRKPKAESFKPTIRTVDSEEAAEVNMSHSDYMQDEENEDGSKEKHLQHRQMVKQTYTLNGAETDEIVPLTMKFYQHVKNQEDEETADNKLKEQPFSLGPQNQLPPKLEQEQQFNQNSSEEEEYHEDSAESLEHLQMPHTTIGRTLGSSITLPPIYQEPVIVGRAGFPLSFGSGGTWTTNNPWTTTTTTNRVTPTLSPAAIPSQSTIRLASASSMTTSPASITSTTSRPAGKQGKQINISRRKLLPHEQLRNYIEDAYIRMPLAVIVDPSAESLTKTKALWRDALRTNLNIKIVLISLNASDIPAAYNFNNTRQFLAGLNSVKKHDGGNVFSGIVRASELVPYDSAVFISTAAIPIHTDLVQDAAITLLKKRIRLYLIWYGERAVSENETQDAVGGILGEVAIRSGGEILHIVGSENSQELEGSTLTLVAEAFRGSQELEIPVDTTLSSLHVKIDQAMRTATLETPNGG